MVLFRRQRMRELVEELNSSQRRYDHNQRKLARVFREVQEDDSRDTGCDTELSQLSHETDLLAMRIEKLKEEINGK